MSLDVSSTVIVRRPRDAVAAFAADPDNAPLWYVNIKAVEWRSSRPLDIGSRVAFIARFVGRRLEYTYEVREYVPEERLVMAAAEAPFPMETTYVWESCPDGTTRMTLRNRGQPTGFSRIVAPLLAMAMRRENRKDLHRLKNLLETGA